MLFPQRGSKAFTLLELIVAIVILGILAAIAIPTFQKVTTRSHDSATETTLSALLREAQALAAFEDREVTAADIEAASEDLTIQATGTGTHAASKKVVAWADGETGAPATATRTDLLYKVEGNVAGVSLASASGNCVFGQVTGVSTGTQTWVGTAETCTGTSAVAGPGSEAAAPVTEPAPTAAFGAQWAVNHGGAQASSKVNDAAVDATTGDTVYTGEFAGRITLGTHTLTASGHRSGFVYRQTPTGDVLWAKALPATSAAYGNGVDVNASGDVHVGGQYSGTLTVDGNSVTSAGNDDAYVLGLDSSGNTKWLVTFGSTAHDTIESAAAGPNGSVLVTGHYSGTVTFGTITKTAGVGGNGYVARINAVGVPEWVTTYSGASGLSVEEIATDTNGNSAITGSFLGTGTFGGVSLSNTSGNWHPYVARLSSTGSIGWGHSIGATQPYAQSYGVDIDPNGNVYSAGYFGNHTITWGSTSITSAGNTDGYLVKHTASGSQSWVVRTGGTGYDPVYKVTTDTSGNAYTGGITNPGSNVDATVTKHSSTGGVLWTAKSSSSTGRSEHSWTVAHNPKTGNVETGGSFDTSATFSSHTVTGPGGPQLHTASVNPSGTFLNARTTSKNDRFGSNQANSVKTDTSGNVYSAGQFVGKNPLGGTTLTSNGGFDGYVAKHDPSGNLLWARSIGGIGSDIAQSVTVDSAGNVLVTGTYHNTLTFDGVTLTQANAAVFVLKLNPSGNLVWLRKLDGTGSDNGQSITVDSADSVYVAGFAGAAVTFAGTTPTAQGNNDVIVAKWTSGGAEAWLGRYGGTASDQAYGIATAPDGGVVVTGVYNGTATFGGTTITSNGSADAYVAKVSAAGSAQWAVGIGGTGYDHSAAVTTHADGRTVIAGSYTNTMTVGATTLTSTGGNDGFVAELAANSKTVTNGAGYGGTGSENAKAVAVTPEGTVLVAGFVAGTVTFGDTTLTSNGGIDGVLAEYSSELAPLRAMTIGGNGNDYGNSVTLNGTSGIVYAGALIGETTIGTQTVSPNAGPDALLVHLAR